MCELNDIKIITIIFLYLFCFREKGKQQYQQCQHKQQRKNRIAQNFRLITIWNVINEIFLYRRYTYKEQKFELMSESRRFYSHLEIVQYFHSVCVNPSFMKVNENMVKFCAFFSWNRSSKILSLVKHCIKEDTYSHEMNAFRGKQKIQCKA